MESFKPPTPPLMKRIFGNHFFQFGMLLVVTGIIGFFISQRSSDSSPWHAFTQKATVQIETAPLTPPPPPPPTTENEKAAPPTPTVTPTEQAEAASVAPAAKPAPKEETKETTKAVTKPHLIVYYAEVSRSALSSIFENSQNTGQFMSFKDYSAGILPGITKQLANSSVKVLHKEDRALDSSKTLQWFYGLKDRRNPSVEIGLT
ncbi:MAG TPA: hypothetical protein VN132_02250, partial [Bdellovibrio sp.]|nr:hypothetical protein [Bdellovibrio sp.]